MSFSDIFIRRPVLTAMINLGLVLAGLISLGRLPVRELPDIDPPIVSVLTVYPGAAAAVVETEVTQRLEDVINGIEGIKQITSTSRDQVSSIAIEFSLVRDIDLAAQDVRDRAARVRGDLPQDIEEPIVSKQDSDAEPMIWIALFGEGYSPLELTNVAERFIKDPLQTVPGVSSVIFGGEKRYAIRLRLDPLKMAATGVTVSDIARVLKEQNVELPSGRVENRDREMVIQTLGELKSPDEFDRLVVKEQGGVLVRLRDVGYAEAGVEDERSIARFNSKPTIGLGVVRQSKANTIEVAKGVHQVLDNIRQDLPAGVSAIVAYDESVFVEDSIKEVWRTLFMAFFLVVAVIFVFLRDLRATIIPALTIPVAVMATFSVLQIMGYSINILTMLGLVLAIGIVVDDSIVVLENIFRHLEKGDSPEAAASYGVREVVFAVLATTVSLLAVFLPLAYQTTLAGRLFIEFAIALSGAVVVSTLVALTLTPMSSAKLLRSLSGRKHGKLFNQFESFFERLAAWYARRLDWALDRRKLVLSLAVLILVLTLGLYLLLPKEFLPEEDKGLLLCLAITPEGSTAEYTDRMVRKMEEIVASFPEVAGYFSAVALPFEGPGDANLGLMFVRFKEDRSRTVQDMLGGPHGLGARFFGEIEGAIAFPIVPKTANFGFGQPYRLILKNDDLENLSAFAEEFSGEMQQGGLIANLRSSFELSKPELRVTIDRDRAASLGISIEEISRTLQVLIGGQDLSTVKLKGEEYEVIVQVARDERLTPSAFEQLYVRGNDGRLVQLTSLISLEAHGSPNKIEHYNRRRSTTLEGSPMGVSLGTVVSETEDLLAERLPPGFSYSWGGEAEDLKEAGRDTAFVALLAVVVIYMVLAAQYESLVHPFTVMLALPLGLFGGLLGLAILSLVNGLGWMLYGWANYAPDPPWIAHVLSAVVPRIPSMSVNLFSQIGMVLLFGLVTKNSILLVDFANRAKLAGADSIEAVREAGRIRFRPILMTAVSTVAGIMPIAIGFGAGADSRRPMGVVVVFGMAVATFLTLFVVPVVYTLLADAAQWVKHRRRLMPSLMSFIAVFFLALLQTGSAGLLAEDSDSVMEQELRTEEAKAVLPEGTSEHASENSSEDASADSENRYTLGRCIQTALEKNFKILAAQTRIREQAGVSVTARAFLLPKLDLISQYRRQDESRLPALEGRRVGSPDFWQTEIQVVQPLYTGGSGIAQRRQSEYLEKASELQMQAVVNNVVLEVKETFYGVLLAEASVKVRQESVNLLTEQLRLAKSRKSAGTVSEFDVLRAEVELANAQTPLIRARNDLRLSLEDLARVLGLDLKSPDQARFFITIEGELAFEDLVLDLPGALQAAHEQRPELRGAKLLVKAEEEGVEIERAAYLPTIEAYGSYGVETSPFANDGGETDYGWRAGVVGTWSLFDSFATTGRVEQAQAKVDRKRVEKDQLYRDVDLEVRRSMSRLVEARELVLASSKVVAQGEESYRLANARLATGVARQIDVLDTQVALTQARSNHVESLFSFNVAKARLERAVGNSSGAQ